MSQQYIDLITAHQQGKFTRKPESETPEPVDWVEAVESGNYNYAVYNHVANMLEEAMRDGIF